MLIFRHEKAQRLGRPEPENLTIYLIDFLLRWTAKGQVKQGAALDAILASRVFAFSGDKNEENIFLCGNCAGL